MEFKKLKISKEEAQFIRYREININLIDKLHGIPNRLLIKKRNSMPIVDTGKLINSILPRVIIKIKIKMKHEFNK